MKYKVFDCKPSRGVEPICEISGDNIENAISQNLMYIACKIKPNEKNHIINVLKHIRYSDNDPNFGYSFFKVFLKVNVSNGYSSDSPKYKEVNKLIDCYILE